VTQGIESLSRGLLLDSVAWGRIGLTVIILILVWLLRRALQRASQSLIEDRDLQYRWHNVISYVTWIIAILFIAYIWVNGLRQVGTFLGLLTAGLAIALKDIIIDFVGWFVILTRSPFKVGDRIQVGDDNGDVVDISILHFTLLEVGKLAEGGQSTGRLILIPNAKILTEHVSNYTAEFPYLWTEIPVTISFESDWRKAKQMFLSIVQEETEDISGQVRDFLKRNPGKTLISYDVVTATIYTSVADHGICLTLRFLTEPRKRRAIQETLWEAVLGVVDRESDIDLAYPTRRIVNLES